MNERFHTQAEISKLAHVLGRNPGEFRYLARVPAQDVRALRERVTARLFSAQAPWLSRAAAASRLLPPKALATIAQRAFGPLLSAQMAAALEPSRAAELGAHLPPGFLAEMALEIDPRRSGDVIGRISPAQAAAVTRALIARGELVTIGRLLEALSDEAIAAALAVMDDRVLLHVAYVLEHERLLARVLDLLDPARLAALVPIAVDDDLWPQALALFSHLGEQGRGVIGAATRSLDHAALETIVAAVIDHDLWEEVLVIAEQDRTLQAKLAERVRAIGEPRRKQLAERGREQGSLPRLGVLGEAIVRGQRA
ncbi:MAG: hypothetical protein JO156_13375 [Solirubrobacterales bacterium]|nr:hypothetical protein [Solirubrobacterales bacterium]